jgi:hypothetical protein
MKRYFISSDILFKTVVVSPLTETQPENSVLYFVNDFVKPCFDVYPNPTTVVEGATEEEIAEANKAIVPTEVQLWRVRTVLELMQLEETIARALENLDEPIRTGSKKIWEYGTTIERQSQTVLFLQSVLQVTDLQVDEIFIQADAIAI